MSTPQRDAFVADFELLHARERELLRQRRIARGFDPDEPRIGLAISSGGVRAAAFGLGVTRALHDKGVYDRLDYLSTVSGGGFTGAFVSWLRRRGSGLRTHEGELVPAAALHFVRQSADYLNPARADGSEPFTDHAPTRATLFGVVLGQMVISLAMCAALLVGLFYLLHIGDAFVTLQKPILLLATRNDVWRFFVTQLNFAAVAGVVVLTVAMVRIVGGLVARALRGGWAAGVPSGHAPARSDAFRGALWLLLSLVTGALTTAALCMLGEGVAPWLGSVGFAALSVHALARCKRHWNVALPEAAQRAEPGASKTRLPAAWLLLPLLSALVVCAALVGLFGFYLFSSGEVPVGDPPVLGRAGGVISVAIIVVMTVGLLPRALLRARRFFARFPAPHDQRASYWRSLTFQRQSGSALSWASFWFVLATLPWWEQLTEHALGSSVVHIYGFGAAFALGSLWICARVVASSRIAPRQRKTLSPTLQHTLLGLLLYGLLVLAHSVTGAILDSSLPHAALWIVATGFVLGGLSELNFAGAGRVYRNRLAETFLPDARAIHHASWLPAVDASDFPLWKLSEVADRGPYQLLNTSLVTDGSPSRKRAERGSDSFILSPLFCGSAGTGWAETRHWQHGRLTLRDAVAISGAAAAPGAGFDRHGSGRNRLVQAGLGVFNLRVQYCADNPNPRYAPRPSRHRPNLLFPGLGSLLFAASQSEKSRHVRLADGGHFEALGVYELLRRKVELIVVADATEDAALNFRALGNALERAREDLGVTIEFDPGKVFGSSPAAGLYGAHATAGVAARGFAVASIRYDDSLAVGTLVYIKPSLIEGLELAVQSFAADHAQFPNAPSSDQRFDEKHFIAYEQLGYQIALRALDEGLARESAHLDSITPPRHDSFIQLKGNALPKAGSYQ